MLSLLQQLLLTNKAAMPFGVTQCRQQAQTPRAYTTHTCSFLITRRWGRSGRTGAKAAASVDRSSLNSGSGMSLTTSSVLNCPPMRPPPSLLAVARRRRAKDLQERRWRSTHKGCHRDGTQALGLTGSDSVSACCCLLPEAVETWGKPLLQPSDWQCPQQLRNCAIAICRFTWHLLGFSASLKLLT